MKKTERKKKKNKFGKDFKLLSKKKLKFDDNETKLKVFYSTKSSSIVVEIKMQVSN